MKKEDDNYSVSDVLIGVIVISTIAYAFHSIFKYEPLTERLKVAQEEMKKTQ